MSSPERQGRLGEQKVHTRSYRIPVCNRAPVKRERHMDAISRKNVIVAAPSLREIEHVTSVHHPLLITSQRGSAAHTHPCNIWQEGEEGQDAARFAGAKICLFCVTCPRAQPRMPMWLGVTHGTAASCKSHPQRVARSRKL